MKEILGELLAGKWFVHKTNLIDSVQIYPPRYEDLVKNNLGPWIAKIYHDLGYKHLI